jgi:hypothetical protein
VAQSLFSLFKNSSASIKYVHCEDKKAQGLKQAKKYQYICIYCFNYNKITNVTRSRENETSYQGLPSGSQ